ncbi:protein MLP1 isoform X1 [Ricinus communis]|uniref:protein MLP1 isoform X1 n=1 Tax=Ricinus communis TaxID=3988 RepID=UPI0007725F47|nr:protein MLP1 isoform X1 [Ricinus communis]XP_048229397.1 protein MLP1 isoform X1 [Ricinus communis]|eukprot:XP_015572062.1 protein MLP1 isoform X1 [Ricinus communis]
MSSSSGDSTLDVEELLQIGTRCKELRKEKDMLRESQSQSFELIRRLELHVKSLSEAHSEDRKHIQKLERELLNCSQEIDYLQDQLNARNAEVYSLGEHVHELELKLVDMDDLLVKISQLQEELRKSDSECFLLIQELERKEVELQKSVSFIEKLEESVASFTLDSQCEIESMKLDVMALEQACCESKKKQEETTMEKDTMDGLVQELKNQVYDAEEIIQCLEKENKELRVKLATSEMNGRIFIQKIEEWMENQDNLLLSTQPYSSELEKENMSKEMSACGEVLGLLFSKLAIVLAPESDLKKQMKRLSHKIREYEVLMNQLKEDLREEKLKAKEEAEDLAQEMAELRHQMTGLLEEECKRRACIEQASLQRIAELEAQIQKEQRKPSFAIRTLHEA